MLDDAEAFPSALPARRATDYAAWVTIQIGCDNSCAFCIVPVGAGPGDQPSVRRARARGRATGRRRRGRGHAARPERELLRPRPAPRRGARRRRSPRRVGGRPGLGRRSRRRGPAAVRRPARGRWPRSTASAGSATPAPTRRTCGPRRSRPWPTNAAVCEHLHLPLQSGSDRRAGRHAPGLHRRALPRAAGRAPGRRSTTWPSPPTSSSGFPGETDDDFERTLEVVAEAGLRQRLHLHLLAPTRHRGGRRGPTSSCRPRSWPSGSSACGWSSSASALARHQARVGRVEEVLVEGPSKKDPAVLTGRTRQNKLVHLPSRRRRCDRAPSPTCAITAGGPHHLVGELVEVTALPRHRTRIPVASV